jgi:RimJ/RimL family protein N-acetyltransferase
VIIYRLDLTKQPVEQPRIEGTRCVVVSDAAGVTKYFPLWLKNWGWKASLAAALKVLSGKRIAYFSVAEGSKVVQSGWANIGFCRFYPVEKNAVVFGTLYTVPEYRNKGLSTRAKSHMIAYLYTRGYRRFYADTTPANVPAQKTSEKLGFQRVSLEDLANS